MTFLDTSVIIDMVGGVPEVVEYVRDQGEPYLTSSMCVFEVVEGKLGAGDTDVFAVRQEFSGVRAIDFDEQIALEAGRIQDRLLDDGTRLAPRDLIVAATARSTGDELVVTDDDFELRGLTELLDVTYLEKN